MSKLEGKVVGRGEGENPYPIVRDAISRIHAAMGDARPRKLMSIREFRDAGYLLEVNRRFFHPLGLALTISGDERDPDAESIILGVYDMRDDPEGIAFAEIDDKDQARAENIHTIEEERKGPRERALGYWVQPL